MSIAPPSDIILDVAQAADPTRRQMAVAKLAEAAAKAGVDPGAFDTAMGAATPAAGHPADGSLAVSPLAGAGRSQVTAGHGSPYQRFEAIMMQSFVEAMLPKDSDLYGDAASADAYRSMFAEKISEQLAKTGRLGVATAIERFEARAAAAAPAVATAPLLGPAKANRG